jgi:hypothetical protein
MVQKTTVTNRLLIRVTALNSKLSPGSATTNKIMNLAWTLTLDEPGGQARLSHKKTNENCSTIRAPKILT